MAELVSVVVFFIGLGAVGIALFWLGFQVWPGRPSPHLEPTVYLGAVEMPPDLPASVARFFQELTDPDTGGVPRTISAAAWGRARLRLRVGGFRVQAPAVFREYILGGQGFRWTGAVRWFRLPFSSAENRYFEGRGTYRTGKATLRGDWMDQAENVRLWVEGVWIPGVWFATPGVRWERAPEASVDPAAVLIVPGPRGKGEERLDVVFDPTTGLIADIRALRVRSAADSNRTVWRVQCSDWEAVAGVPVPRILRLFWDDVPAGELYLDGLEYNVLVTLE